MRPSRWQGVTDCNQKCPGGSPCDCQDLPYKKHEWHCCNDPACFCHSRERYEPAPKPDWGEPIISQGIRFQQYLGKTGPRKLQPKNLTYEEWIDLRRARGEIPIPDDVAPGIFGEELDIETFDNLIDLMEEEPNG